jgi:transposase
MAAPVSNEIREKIIIHKQNKAKESDIANWLIISQSTVTKVWSLYKTTGSYLPLPRTQGRKPLVSDKTMSQVVSKIKETPDITLLELIEEFELTISESALCKRLVKLGYSFKKRQHIRQSKIALTYKKSAKNS